MFNQLSAARQSQLAFSRFALGMPASQRAAFSTTFTIDDYLDTEYKGGRLLKSAKPNRLQSARQVTKKLQRKSTLNLNNVRVSGAEQNASIQDKLRNVIRLSNGRIVHKHLKTAVDGDSKYLKPRVFKNVKFFQGFLDNWNKNFRKTLRARLTPFQFWLTQEKGTERPFTGDHWWRNEVGRYDCAVCSQRLFLSEHKYQSKSGYATFWNNLKGAINLRTDSLEAPDFTNAHIDPTLRHKQPIKRLSCSHCDSHVGHVYNDGPPPYGLRYQVNSGAVIFEKKPWFEIPPLSKEEVRRVNQMREQSWKGQAEFDEIVKDEELFNIPIYTKRQPHSVQKV